MSEVNNKNMYLDLAGLKTYDGLIKKFITDNVAALNAKLGEFEFDSSDDKTVAAILEDIKSAITELVAKDVELEKKDAELEKKIAEEIGKIVGELGESDSHMTLVQIAAQLKSLGDRVTANKGEISGVNERVIAVEEAIRNLGKIEGGESLGEIVSEVKANTAALNSLKGDAETVTAAVNKIAKDAADAAQAAAEANAAADATTKANAAQAAAEAYVDSKVDGKFDEAGAAAQALADAKADAASLYQVKGDYEAAGAAAQALADAKAYVNGIVDDVTGEDGVVTKGLNSRIADLEAIDHDQLVADAVAAVVADADSDFDTLREVADWIAADTTGSAALQTTVAGHTKSINTINGELGTLKTDVEKDITNLEANVKDAATALEGVDERLVALEAFEETHASIPTSKIEDWWYGRNTEE